MNLTDHDFRRFQLRLLQDAFSDATAATWSRRAAAFETARPHPRDHPGQATPTELHSASQRCDTVARACRAHATNRHRFTGTERDQVLYLSPGAVTYLEPVDQMIARHRRILDALDRHHDREAA